MIVNKRLHKLIFRLMIIDFMTSAYTSNFVNACKAKSLRYIKPLAIFLFFIITLPSCVPRCTKFPAYTQCQVRMRHIHGGKEYRGVPIYKKQNMQYGEKYKGPSKDTYSVSRTPKNKKRLVKKKKNITTKIKTKKKRTSSPIISPFPKNKKGG